MGFMGIDCSEISNPCLSQNPCRNGADCVPLQLGRYKCKCLPGWNGLNCEHNIGTFLFYLIFIKFLQMIVAKIHVLLVLLVMILLMILNVYVRTVFLANDAT